MIAQMGDLVNVGQKWAKKQNRHAQGHDDLKILPKPSHLNN
jgi:hypothetical protein